ncbi:MAG: RNA-guided endonuclease TnpB family protein [Caldilineaceae bacterium]
MLKTYKYRIYPSKAQITQLETQLELCRFVYNKTLAIRKDAWEQRQAALGYYDTAPMLPLWKKEKPDLKKVHSQVLQNVQMRVDLAYKAFFRRVKAGEDPGYPRFKGRGWYDSMCYPQYGNGVTLEGNKLSLSKIGTVKVKLHRALCGTPKTVCIRRGSGNKWFVTITCECPDLVLPADPKAVGVDVGLQAFATLSNGDKLANPRFFRSDEKALVKAQRKLAKAAKGTSERKQAKQVVGRIHERIRNKRADFSHQVSRQLVNNFSIICFEDLAIKEMMANKPVFGNKLNKSIADVAWRQLVQFTTYKAESAGRRVVLVDPKNTSKRCSRCGSLVNKDLSVRVHTCPTCGLILDRDHNAAINILALGLQRMGTQSLEAQVL